MKTHLLWDHDGVLVDTEPWYFEATRQCIAPLGVSLELDAYLQDMVHGTPAWQRASLLGVPETEVRNAKAQRDALYQHFLMHKDIDIPGVEAVLGELARRHLMAIVTTAKRTDFELIHQNRGIVEHMQFVLASGDYPRAKPHPDPYLSALRKFNVAADNALVIEDSERGLRAAVAAGIDCVVVHNAFIRGQDLSAARYHIETLAELPALLRLINDL